LWNLPLSYIYEAFVSTDTILVLILFLYISLYFWAFFKGYKIFVEANKEALTLLCKQLQNFLNDNQTPLFIIVNALVFLGLSFSFDPTICVIVHIIWLDLYFLFYFLYIINFPIVQVVLICSLLFRIFVFGLFSKTVLCLVLFGVYILSCMDQLGFFNSLKTTVAVLQNDQLKLLNHKKTEFLFFYVLEQQYVVLLILSILVPGTLREVGVQFDLSISEQDFLFHIYFYAYSFIMVITIINLIVVWFFNPGPFLKTAAACIGCVGGVAAGASAYVQYQDSVWDRATGGIREPGPSKAVADAQLSVFNARIATAEGVKQAKIYREIFPNPLPVSPGTNIVNNYEVSRALIEDTTPFQKERINQMLGRNPAGLPYPKENPVKSLASKTGKGF